MGCSFRPDWVAGFLRIRWQLCTGLGGRNHRNTQLLQIKMDNGSESNGVRTQFLHRMVQFADHIAKCVFR